MAPSLPDDVAEPMDNEKRRGLRHGVDENPIPPHDQRARTWLRQRTP
ncbi:MAG TPA: hypothetical protein G4O11_01530 [Anaerolineae bacterium]|nr:hypothetical protein [Anaerolineae bacterium]